MSLPCASASLSLWQSLSLEEQIEVTANDSVVLPALCQWHVRDLEEAAGSSSLNNRELLALLLLHVR